MQNTLVIAGLMIPLLLSLLGWAYQLGRSDARTSRNEKDIADLQKLREENARELRESITANFDKVYVKLDALPCHNPRWKGDC